MSLSISEILFSLGEENHNTSTPIVPPIYQSSNFSFKDIASLRAAFVNERDTHLYTRGNNPTVEIVRKKIAALAGAEDALIVSSGAAAIALAILSQVKSGDHVICVKHPYSWTEKFCRIILARFGVETTFWDANSELSIFDLVKDNTRAIYLESPNTFTFELQDVRKIAAFCKEKNIVSIIDNTYSTPLGQRCIEMGIDLEVHSISKYLNGHSDVIAGAIIGSKKIIEPIFHSEFLNFGAITSPHDAWLILRGLRTLPQRMEMIGKSTKTVIDFLISESWVDQVLHPFHSSFRQSNLAVAQMTWHGGLFSIVLKERDVNNIEDFCEKLTAFKMAVSWGGHESLMMPCSSFYPKDYAGQRKYPLNMIRFYIGLESSEYLIADLKQAATVFVR